MSTAPQWLRKPYDAELLLATPTAGRFVVGQGAVSVASPTNRIFVHCKNSGGLLRGATEEIRARQAREKD
jgi:hypothetical protein